MAVLAAAVAMVGVAVAVSNPVDQVRSFTQPPDTTTAPADFVQAHLLSSNGSGRWQFWGAALDEWRSAPIVGRGAGSYEAWWAQHGTLRRFIRDAHSLYVEVLGELGIIGFLIVIGIVGTGLVVGARRVRTTPVRPELAALLAVFAAYAFGAGIDWMWELTVVSVVGFVVLGLLVGPATDLATDRGRRGEGGPGRLLAGVSIVAVGWIVICAQVLPLLKDRRISDSQAAVARDDASAALRTARDAHSLQPWSPEPYRQEALIQELLGNLPAADKAIHTAIDRDREDWRLWLIAVRIETKRGDIAAARASLNEARRLNPRSSLFATR
jgi:O-antigen ligase